MILRQARERHHAPRASPIPRRPKKEASLDQFSLPSARDTLVFILRHRFGMDWKGAVCVQRLDDSLGVRLEVQCNSHQLSQFTAFFIDARA
jgi:hypothetical protein